jgi:hypothetical protein
MNERLQQLAREAGHFEFNKWDYFDIKKFAELIVRECALQCVHNEDMDLIEKHFGVDI